MLSGSSLHHCHHWRLRDLGGYVVEMGLRGIEQHASGR